MAKRGTSYRLWELLRGETAVRLYGKSPWNKDVKLPPFAWPGGACIIYFDRDGTELCNECATNSLRDRSEIPQFKPIGYFLHEEGQPIYCEQCNHFMMSGYGDPDLSDEENNALFDYKCDCTRCKEHAS